MEKISWKVSHYIDQLFSSNKILFNKILKIDTGSPQCTTIIELKTSVAKQELSEFCPTLAFFDTVTKQITAIIK